MLPGGYGADTPHTCTIAVERYGSAPKEKERQAAVTMRCDDDVTSVGVWKPKHKRIDAYGKVTHNGVAPGQGMKCSAAAGNRCTGFFNAGTEFRFRVRWEKPVCSKPRLRVTVVAQFVPQPCPGPNPCPANIPTGFARSGPAGGC
jgi:hypothetical protein